MAQNIDVETALKKGRDKAKGAAVNMGLDVAMEAPPAKKTPKKKKKNSKNSKKKKTVRSHSLSRWTIMPAALFVFVPVGRII
eukprot:SAG11_NODE_3660_length_2303_cov_1.401089_2_plen_82_part_00